MKLFSLNYIIVTESAFSNIDLDCDDLIGAMCVTGTFGRVYFGTLLAADGSSNTSVDQPVIVKTVTGKSPLLIANLYSAISRKRIGGAW